MVNSLFFQQCIGVSIVILSAGGTYSMISGALVKINVAGTNISVNEKLQRVDKIARDLEQSADLLKQEPTVSKLKIRAIEKELEAVETDIEASQQQLQDDLKQLVEGEDRE